MPQPSRAALALADRLIRIETREGERDGADPCLAAERVLQRLGLHLAPLVGVVGLHALLTRSLALASVQAEWLSAVKVTPEGVPGSFVDAAPGRSADDVARGCSAVVLELLGLLVTFIGEGLTYRLAAKAWSDPTINHSRSTAREPPQ